MDSKARAMKIAEGNWWRTTRRLVAGTRRSSRAQYGVIYRRFASPQWSVLVQRTWAPFVRNAIEDGADLDLRSTWPEWERMALAVLLEVAFEWAAEPACRVSIHPWAPESRTISRLEALRADAARLEELNREILSSIDRLRHLLWEQGEIQDRGYVRSEWDGPGLGLWENLEVAAQLYPAWSFVCEDERTAFLRIAREQSRPGPKLVDLLSSIVDAQDAPEVYAAHADDARSIARGRGAARDTPAERVQRFLASLGEAFRQFDRVGQPGRALRWLEPTALCNLLAVADGRPVSAPAPFTVAAVKNARDRYLQSDDS